MITLENVSFSYREKQILNDISMTFERGKIYTLLGLNGSGKTTLLNLIGRISAPAAGKLLLENAEYSSFSKKAFSKKTAYLSQIRSIPDICVYDLVAHGRFPHLGFSRRLTEKDSEIIDNALEMTELKALCGKNLHELSGGERQRAYIGMLLAQEADFILLDEPTSYLDIPHSYDVIDIIKKLRQNNKCLILVLHDIISALKISDCIIVLNDGKINAFYTPEELLSSGLLERVFNIKCINIQISGENEYIIRQK